MERFTHTRMTDRMLIPLTDPVSRTRIRVSRPPDGGRVKVAFDASSRPDRPAIRPMLLSSDDDGARVSLVPDGALLLAGDQISLDVAVGAGARLELVEPAGTVAYSMDGGEASWSVTIDLAPASSLIWAGEPFVIADGATVERSIDIRMGWHASLAMREVVVLGRHGERAGTLRQRLSAVADNGVPILAEELEIDPRSGRWVLGGTRVMGSVLVLGARLKCDVIERNDMVRMDLEAEGTLLRSLVADAHRATHDDVWAGALEALR
jgi:urease accessory protein